MIDGNLAMASERVYQGPHDHEPASQSELIRRCTAEEWHEAYKARLIERGIDLDFAQSTLEAGMDDFDYDDSPADAADMELSCWVDL